MAEHQRPSRCHYCQYDLCGLPPEHPCPECGRPVLTLRQRYVSDLIPTWPQVSLTTLTCMLVAVKIIVLSNWPSTTHWDSKKIALANIAGGIDLALGTIIAVEFVWILMTKKECGRGWLVINITAIFAFLFLTSAYV